MDEQRREDESEVGKKGGATEAYMTAGAIPRTETLVSALRRFRWDAVLAGTASAIALMMLFVSLGIAIGLTFGRFGTGGGLAYWIVGSAAVGLFLGSWLAAKYAVVTNLWSAVAHGFVMWSLFMILDRMGVDLIGGISRLLFAGVMTGNVATTTAKTVLTGAGWWFFIGYLIALAAAVLGSVAGLAIEEHEEQRV